jgi:polyhydroxyalkanoate synthase
VFKIHLLADTGVTFILTNGGHNAGILSEPGHAHRQFRMASQAQEDQYVDPDAWFTKNPPHEGSWWPAWASWLVERSGALGPTPSLGRQNSAFAALCEAPGRYVLMK